MTRSAGDDCNSWHAGRPPAGIRHMHGCRLVADVNKLQPGPDRRIEDRHDVISREREYIGNAGATEGARDDIGTADHCTRSALPCSTESSGLRQAKIVALATNAIALIR